MLRVAQIIKDKAATNVFTFAAEIVEDVLVRGVEQDQAMPSMPKLTNCIFGTDSKQGTTGTEASSSSRLDLEAQKPSYRKSCWTSTLDSAIIYLPSLRRGSKKIPSRSLSTTHTSNDACQNGSFGHPFAEHIPGITMLILQI